MSFKWESVDEVALPDYFLVGRHAVGETQLRKSRYPHGQIALQTRGINDLIAKQAERKV